jgi:hypothetical protein
MGTTWSKALRPDCSVMLSNASAGRALIPGSEARTGLSTPITNPGYKPRPTHNSARAACGVNITTDDSVASPAASLLGSARNVMPNAFTKQAAASALVSASTAPPIGNRKRTSGADDWTKP